MRGRGVALVCGAIACAVSGACTLFFDTGGFTGGAPDAASSAADAAVESSVDATTISDGGGIVEAGGDALAYRDEVMADKPVFYLRLEETSGTLAKDEVGGPSTYEGPAQLGVPGPIAGSNAVKLGGDSAINAGQRAPFSGKAPFSLEGWLKAEVYDSEFRAMVSSFQSAGKRNSYTVWVHATQGIGFDRFIDGDFRSATLQDNMPSPSSWHHFVGVYDGTSLLLYVDAELRATEPDGRSATALVSAPLWVGRAEIDSQPVLGSIDEIAIYDKALTAQRIKAHFEAATK